jgi:antitoxin PrlF
MKTRVSARGRVTIRKPLRDQLGLRAGQTLEVSEEGRNLIFSKTGGGDAIDRMFGVLKLGRSTDEIIKELRGECPRKALMPPKP